MKKIDKNEEYYQKRLNIILLFCLIPGIFLSIKAISLVGTHENILCIFDCEPLEEPLSVSDAFEEVFVGGLLLLFVGGWIYYLILGVIAVYFLVKIYMIRKK